MKNTNIKFAHQPRISVVIPAFNEAEQLHNCLSAVYGQTQSPFEVIVVDNNSTDGTADIARLFPRVRIINETKQGIHFARNTGFNAATGNIIARTDADSWPDADWLEKIALCFKQARTTAITGPIYYYDMPAKRMVRGVEGTMRQELNRLSSDIRFLAGANMAIRRKAWEQVQAHVCSDASLHEDLDLAIHLNQQGLHIKFCRDMFVATSARRITGTAKEFHAYMRRYEGTYHAHGVHDLSLKIPMALYVPLRPLLKVVHRAYNPSLYDRVTVG